MTGWLVAALAVLGADLLAVVKADLEDAAVCRWLARQMVYRAADHLPRGEPARWREESIRDLLDLPGRLPPLLWALDIYARSRSWGRERGVPSRWQVLVVRVREAWHRRPVVPRQGRQGVPGAARPPERGHAGVAGPAAQGLREPH